MIEDHGQPKHNPARYTRLVQFDVTAEQHGRLKATAHLLGVSMSEVLRRGIEEMAAKVEEEGR